MTKTNHGTGLQASKSEGKEGGRRTQGLCKSSQLEAPLVTVITVVLNGDRHLEQTILSILGQNYPNIEYLVIDGGSTDNTLAIIERYQEQLDYWRSEPDRGIYDAMNKGLSLARGDLIALLNADDYYERETVRKVITAYLHAPPECLLYGHTRLLQEDLDLTYIMPAHTDHWKGMGFSHSAMFVHRAIYQKLGPYDCQYTYAADYDYLLKALKAGVAMVQIDAVLSNYRNTGMSASNLVKVLEEMRRISREHFTLFSSAHMKFLLFRYAKSMLLIGLQKLLALCGLGTLQSLKRLYIRTFLVRR